MDELPEQLTTKSDTETCAFGERTGQALKGGEIILLTGSMGAGKSVMARGIARGLGVEAWRGSPTFTIVNEYASKSGPALYHMDLYRLTSEEAEDLGLEEYARPDAVMVIEWADRALPFLLSLPSSRTLLIDIGFVGAEERIIAVQSIEDVTGAAAT